MPYIRQDRRRFLYPRPGSESLHNGDRSLECRAKDPGELNFQITHLLHQYLQTKGLNYGSINDCVGALEGAKLEFYRRVAVPYEDAKILQNGDVYLGTETDGHDERLPHG